MAKSRPEQKLKEIVPFNRNEWVINKIEALIEKEKKMEHRLLHEEEHVEVKGDVVEETSRRLDKLI